MRDRRPLSRAAGYKAADPPRQVNGRSGSRIQYIFEAVSHRVSLQLIDELTA